MLDRLEIRRAPTDVPGDLDLLPPANARVDSEQAREAQPLTQGVFVRLYVRRWLVLLFAAIVAALCALYPVPWHGAVLAFICFACGTALIPRSGLPVFPRPFASAASLAEPAQIAASLIDALPEPAILLSQDGAILCFNAKASDLFGGLRKGLHISGATRNPQVLDAVAASSWNKPWQTVSFSDRVPVERHMAGTIAWLGAKQIGNRSILLCIRDLTEQRRLDQLRSDFIANASHEIKTPLASLLGFIQTLQGAAREDQAARERFLAIMAKQAERMARLIDNLMSLSRVEMHAHLRPQDPVVIAELVLQACETLEPMAAEANIKVWVNSELSEEAVLGDRDELAQVFINLLHNAIKYGKSNGYVQVEMTRLQSQGARMIEISVEDDGPGIAPQHLPRLTERFYRVGTSASLEKGGTGLGLAIVKHVVNRHRGELRISSEEGKGAKFTVVLTEHTGGDFA